MSARTDPPLCYTVSAPACQTHRFEVRLRIARPQRDQLVSLPVWIPGSYLVREFAKNLQGLCAYQNGQALPLEQLDKCTWKIGSRPDECCEISYQIVAFDRSVRSAWLDTQRGFFNGTSVCLRVHGQERLPHVLELPVQGYPPHWQAACALPLLDGGVRGLGRYQARDYDELVDSPVELGEFWQGQFDAYGVPHRVVVSGAPPGFDGSRLLADIQAICRSQIALWHPDHTAPPHDSYLFLIAAQDEGYGGLEHRASTALIVRRADLPRHGMKGAPSEGYTTVLGLVSHEYFHTWNVKRLRPAEFVRYDFARENYTELLWFFEGLTSYFDDLMLVRCGRIGEEDYLKLLARTVNKVLQTPGRHIQSLARASRDAWIKFYRPDEHTPNTTVSYYDKGALLGLCLDLTLRQRHASSLEALMRALWQRCQGGPMTEDDVRAEITRLGDATLAQQVQRWVHECADLPVAACLQTVGVCYEFESTPRALQLGLKAKEQQGVHITHVLRDSAAEAAGFAPGDECLAVTLGQGRSARHWRVQRISDFDLLLDGVRRCQVWVSRDAQVLPLKLTLPAKPAAGVQTVRLRVADAPRVRAWLRGSESALD
ncbi:MAG: PDZ domain-containing protein [Rhodoferax sp.]